MRIYKTLRHTVFLIVFGMSVALAQISGSGNFGDYVASYISGLPGADGNDYTDPSTTEASAWQDCITLILQGSYALAHAAADDFGYQLVEYADGVTLRTYYVLEKQSASLNYWGMFVYNPSASRPRLFIQSPHPKYDTYTGQQGAYIFRNQDCGALFITGTHRCNSSTETNCSGTSSVCGSSGPYKISDQPHNTAGTLQLTTEVLNNAIENLIVIQPHGFAKDDTDPYLIMSNGTRYTPSPDYVSLIRDSLLVIDNTLTFKIAHIDTDWNELIGLTNTQGRLINNSSNPCLTNATSTTGRFIHIEQAYTGLRNSEATRKKLSDAIGMTFPVETGLTLTAPAGNASITADEQYEITWTTTGTISHVNLEYSVDNGANWTAIVSNVSNTDSYWWTVPKIGTWRAKVRVSDVGISRISAQNSSPFKIDYTVYPTTGSADNVQPVSPFGSRLLNGVYDFHRGLDFSGSLNDPIFASRPGIVVRFEDSTETAQTDRARFGSWMLVRIDSSDGQPRHNAYLHLNGFTDIAVGDTVSTEDTIAFMGKSGYEINTVHLHFELYQNLTGTSINKDKARNPLELLPYSDLNGYQVNFLSATDSAGVEIILPATELDFDEVTLYGSSASRTIGFNSRTGIDPDNNDNPNYNDVYIEPSTFNQSSTQQDLKFWVQTSAIGALQSVRITDVNDHSFTVSQTTTGSRYAVSNGNWSGAIWAAASDDEAGSASMPTKINDVIINANATVAINDATAECNSLTFAATTAQLNFTSASAVLHVYGDFTPSAATHVPFSGWTGGALLKFCGDATTQTIGNIGSDNESTSMAFFKTIIVDKTAGKVTFSGTADSKLNLSDSLVIKNGTFQIPAIFDINGRSFNGSNYAYPVIKIESGGILEMLGGASQIVARSGSSMQSIGKMNVYGQAILASTSSNRIRISNVDVEDGGTLAIPYYSSGNMGTEKFDAGTITLKSGGKLTNALNTDIWYSETSIALKSGGIYETTSSTPVLPTFSENQGTILYARSSASDQKIVDADYYNLAVKYSASDAQKNWYLGSDRTISGDFLVTDSAAVVIFDTLNAGRKITVNGAINITSGSIDNTDDSVTIELASSASLTETFGNTVVGKIQTTRTVAQGANNTFGGLGVEINASGAAPGATTVVRTTGTASTGNEHQGIKRWFDISPTTNSGLNATLVFKYNESELNDIPETTLHLYKSIDEGVTWSYRGGSVDVDNNRIILNAIDSFSRWTAGGTGDDSLPVVLESFTAELIPAGVRLSWSTASETENLGFIIYRATLNGDTESETEAIATFLSDEALAGQGTTSEKTQYSYIDSKVIAGQSYVYYLANVSYDGTEELYCNRKVTIAVNSGIIRIPGRYSLQKAYPNPFNATLTIPFILNEKLKVTITVFDVNGREVRRIINKELPVGQYALYFQAADLASGVYILKCTMGTTNHLQRILLLK